MRKRILLSLLTLISITFGCNVEINPVRCEINVKQANIVIPNNTGYFNFGNIPLKSLQSITFTIENNGSDVLKLTGHSIVKIIGADTSDFIVATNQTNRYVNAYSSTDFKIYFFPQSLGSKTITVLIYSTDIDKNPYSFIIIGKCTSTAPEIHIKQGSTDILSNTGVFDFGNTKIGVPKTIVFTIENNGNKELLLTGINLNGNSYSMFSIDDSNTSYSVYANNPTTFSITFKPTSAGIMTTKVLILNNDSDENPYSFTLYGTGTASPIMVVKQDTNIIPNNSGSYQFDDTTVGLTSEAVVFTIENNGTLTLNLEASEKIEITGIDQSMFAVNVDSTVKSIAPGSSTTFTVEFSPTSVGQKNALIYIANDDTNNNPFKFTIEGKGIDPEINVKQGSDNIPNSTGTYDFGNVAFGTSSPTTTFTIDNSGVGDLKLSGNPKIAVSGSNSAEFIVNESDTLTFVSNGASTTFTITCTPTSLGSKTASISIDNNDSNENPYTFTLEANCVNHGSGEAIGWIGGRSNGWKTGTAPSLSNDYQSFYTPNGMCLDQSGNIYVADYDNNRISKWDSNGNAIGWIGGGSNGWKTGTAPVSNTDYRSFSHPSDVFVDSGGYIYVADYFNHRICKWDSAGNAVGWIGAKQNGWQTMTYTLPSNDYKSFNTPSGVFVDSAGYIYVTDLGNERICKWDSSGNAVGWIGGGSSGWKTSNAIHNGYWGIDSFKVPFDVFVDSGGFIYVADRNNHRVVKWNSTGNPVGWIGGASSGWKTIGTLLYPKNDYQSFNNPRSIYVSSAGDIYVAERGTNRISKWDKNGNAKGWIGGGSNGWKTANGASNGTDYQSFSFVSGVFVRNGIIYCSDENNDRICSWFE